ncbi:uncharacterized protein BCR38DRAFT_145333 [Pseudomassariella vexata]|uniref:Uncharacterized protein n=1 Tax=Pseudomassariella vexata TaxID=1141098 RepID=A0A1Y2D6Z3_9PEZI|nr:uncharacterized protein BCR38DRAFT_145333 [Pseudomassariella vexata]ORY54967.1 hypothetical protein BCR38DRAFT_145333 [Pseudomassariella vexata]
MRERGPSFQDRHCASYYNPRVVLYVGDVNAYHGNLDISLVETMACKRCDKPRRDRIAQQQPRPCLNPNVIEPWRGLARHKSAQYARPGLDPQISRSSQAGRSPVQARRKPPAFWRWRDRNDDDDDDDAAATATEGEIKDTKMGMKHGSSQICLGVRQLTSLARRGWEDVSCRKEMAPCFRSDRAEQRGGTTRGAWLGLSWCNT